MKSNFWDQNSEQWRKLIENGGITSRAVTGPALVSSIHRKNLKSVLDVGCGEGWLSRALSPTVKYLGIDGSASLIEIARKSSSAAFEKVTYEDLANGRWKSEGLFDGVVFNFSLFDKDIENILNQVRKFLNPDGLVIIQTLHPCFKLSRYTDGWHHEDFKMAPMAFTESMSWFGRTLQSWIQLFSTCHFYLDDLLEPANSSTENPVSIIYFLKQRA